MKRVTVAVLLVLSACSGSGLDQGTIDVCHSIIGFDRTEITSADSWLKVAQAGTTVAKNSVVKKASQDILSLNIPYSLRNGFSSQTKAALLTAVARMADACKTSGGYKGKVSRLYG